MKQSIIINDEESDDGLSPLPEDTSPAKRESETTRAQEEDIQDESMETDPEAGPSRRGKRKVSYAESGAESSDDEPISARPKGELLSLTYNIQR